MRYSEEGTNIDSFVSNPRSQLTSKRNNHYESYEHIHITLKDWLLIC